MIKKSTKTILYSLSLLFAMSFQLQAGTVNYQFAGNESLSTDKYYCIDIQLNTSNGAEALGSGSIRFSYDPSVLLFAGQSNSEGTIETTGYYVSHLLNDEFVSEECNNMSSQTGVAPYAAHSYDGNVTGQFLMTNVLNFASNNDVEFACPSFSNNWKSVGTVCFEYLKPEDDPNLKFMGTENGVVTDLSGSNFNDPTDQPENGLENGTFGNWNTSYAQFRMNSLNCGDIYLDSGGDTGQYSNNESDTMTFCPTIDGEFIQVTFGEDAAVEPSTGNGSDATGCWDYLAVFDGASTDFPTIGNYCTGGNTPSLELAGAVITSTATDGCLTFVFNSDGSTIQDGWSASVACISEIIEGCTDPIASNYDETATVDDGTCEYVLGCTNPLATNYNENATMDDGSCEFGAGCNSAYFDTGGADADYSSDESELITFCPDNAGELIEVEFISFSVENNGTTGCWDGLTIYDGADTTAPTIDNENGSEWCWDLNDTPAIGTGDPVTAGPFLSSDPSGCLTFLFESDGTVTRAGWEAMVNCVDANSIVFGCTDPIAENYDSNANTEDGSCEYIFGCTDPLGANYNPDATMDDGSCVPGCGGTFTDMGGADGAYLNNVADETYTICPDAGTILVITFTEFEVENNGTAACWDDLQIILGTDLDGNGGTAVAGGFGNNGGFCGDDISALPSQGVFTSGNFDECMTFILNTDGFVTNAGWVASVTCQTELDIPGCTDATAINYNPGATSDDGSCVFPPANNDCVNAIPITLNVINGPYTNVNATATDGAAPGCWFDNSYQNSVYFSFVGDGNQYSFTSIINCDGISAEPNTDTQFAVFEGACDGPEVICDDDGGEGFLSSVFFTTTAGTTYYLVVDGWNGADGDFCIESAIAPPPDNDECGNATVITLGDGVQEGPFSNEFATESGELSPPGCFFGEDAYSETVWFTFVGDGNGYNLTTSNDCTDGTSNLTDTQIALYDDCSGALIYCNDDQDGSLLSEMAFQTEAGVSYSLVVDGFAGATGDFCLNLTEAVVGCTDPGAINYNPMATADDGTCEFPCTVFFSFVQGTPATGFDIIGFPFPTCAVDWNGLNGDPAEVFVAVALSDDAINSPYVITTTGGTLYSSTAPPTLVDPLVVPNLTIALLGLTDADLAGGPITVSYESANNPTCTGSLTIDPATFGLASDLCPLTPVPDNDECANAIELSVGANVINGPYTNLGANTSDEDGVPTAGCFFGGDEYQSTVWFTFEGDGNEYTIQSFNCDGIENLNGDTQFTLFEGGCDGTEIDCDDDGGAGLLSSLSIATTAGQTYTLLVDGWSGSTGEFCLVFLGGGIPENDLCEDATEITLGGINGPYTNTDATAGELVGTPSCWIETTFDNTVYFTFVGDGQDYIFSTSNTCEGVISPNTDTQITIYEGSCEGTEVACDDDGGVGFMSLVEFTPTDGTVYYVLVDGFFGASGDFCLNAVLDVAPDNDECVDAALLDLTDGAVNGPLTNTGATVVDTTEVTPGCFFGEDPYQTTVYYTFVGDGNSYTLETTNDCDGIISPNADTQLALFEGCDGPEITCDDDGGVGLLSQITFSTEPGVSYVLLVDGFAGTAGDFCITVSQLMPPSNDDCANAIDLSIGDGVSNGPFTNLDATSVDETSPDCFLDLTMDNTVYFSFVGDGEAYIINTAIDCAGAFDPLTDASMAIYEGACDGPEIACDDNSGALNLAQIALQTEAGVTYFVVVDGNNGQQGDFCINFESAIIGCTDPFASNFNPDAVAEDGSCEYTVLCGETFTDPGGPINNYPDNSLIVWTICPENPADGEVVLINFSEFDLENNFDFLNIYDGTDVNSPLISSLTGAVLPGDVFASNETGCLTVEFISDFIFNNPGFVASVTCTADLVLGCPDPLASNYNPDATVVVDCTYDAEVGGAFVDEGGPNNVYPGAATNPDTTIICPDELGQTLVIEFLEFDVEAGAADGCWDQLEIWEDVDGDQMISAADVLFEGGQDAGGGFCGDLSSLPNNGIIESTGPGNCLIFILTGDDDFDAGNQGWFATIDAETAICEASAGTTTGPSSVESGEDITVSVEGNNTSSDYITLYLLTQGPDLVIKSVSSNGTFSGMEDGEYCVHTFNALIAVFSEIQVNYPMGFIEVPAGELLGSLSDNACYELNSGNDPGNCLALSLGGASCDLVLAIFEDECDDLTSTHQLTFEVINGSGDYTVSLNGAAPFSYTSDFIFDEVSGNPEILYSLEVTDVNTGCTGLLEVPIGDCAKACDAEAGVLTGIPEGNTYCGGESLTVGAEGFISGGGIFSQLFILSQDDVIIAVSDDGNFGDLEDGTYCIWQYSYVTEEAIIPEIGTLVPVFQTDIFSQCVDLGDEDGNCTEIIISESPIQITYVDECDEATNVHDITFSFTAGSGQYSVVANGGSPEDLGGNPFYFASINSGTTYSLVVTDIVTGCTSSFSELFEDCVKACDALSGTISLDQTVFCTNEPITGVSSDGFQALLPFTQTHILVNDAGVVVAISETGDFGTQAVGLYCAHPLNYVTADGSPLAIGDDVEATLMSLDENICFALDLNCAQIAVVAAADPQPMNNGPVCVGETIQLTAADGFVSYAWTGGPDGTFSSADQNPTATSAGTYTVTVTDASGCTSSASTTVDSNPALILAIDPANPEVCMGSSVNLGTDGSADWSYAWSASGGTFDDPASADPVFSMMMPGTYVITVVAMDAAGCEGTATTNVTINPIPTEDDAPAVEACADAGAVVLTAPIGYTYEWPDGSDASTYEVTASGDYVLIITDGNGCTDEVNYPVTIVDAINEPAPDAVAACDETTLTAPDGYTYTWDGGSADQTLTVTSSGSYSVTISSGVCNQVLVYDVTIDASPAEAQPDPIVFCDGGEPQTLTAPDGYSYSWDDGTDGQSITVSSTGIYSVVLSSGDCTQTLDYNVSFNGINEQTENNIEICSGDLPYEIVAPSGYTNAWSDGTSGASISISDGGVYTLTVSSDDCDLLITYNVTVTPDPTVSISADDLEICEDEGMSNLDISADDGASITWSSNGGFLSSTNSTSTTFSSNTSGVFTVTVTVSNGDCSSSDDIEITVLPDEDSECNPPGSIGDFVFFDFNMNGIFDGDDEPKMNATVYLYNADGDLIDSDATDENGNYLFDNLEPGTYEVCLAISPDEFVTTAGCYTINLGPGEDYLDADFGCLPIPYGSIGDQVFNDNNQNGVYDAGDTPKEGVTVFLTGPNGTSTDVTNSNGEYLFDQLEPGIYEVCVETSAGVIFTTPTCYTVDLGDNEDYVDADFGCYEIEEGSIGDFVFYDANGNGIFDPGEDPKDDATLYLYDEDGEEIAVTSSNSNGYYIFDELEPGEYTVCIGASEGSVITTANCYDVNLGSNEDYLDADFGCMLIPNGSIGDQVFYDNNGNGIYDAGDEPKGGAVITITGPNTNETAVTNSNGNYLFDDLLPGIYEVCIAVGSDVELTTPQCYTVDLDINENYVDADFGCIEDDPGSIGDFVFYDANADGVYNPADGDTPKGGATVHLFDEDGDFLDATVTNSDGLYLFDDLEPGIYEVCFIASSSTLITTPSCFVVNLDAGENYLSADFGCFEDEGGNIGNFVFIDYNGNGIYDGDDEPKPNAELVLLDESGNEIDNTDTNSDGIYNFSVDNGTYTVCLEPGSGEIVTTVNCYTITISNNNVTSADFGCEPDIDPICEAESGEIELISGTSTICGGGAITVSADGFYQGGDVDHIYVLTDENDIIRDISVNSGVFTGLPDGSYTIYSFSYDTEDFNSMPSIGQDFFASYLSVGPEFCWDVSDGIPVEVGADLDVIVEVSEECDDDFNYTVSMTVTGGVGGLLTLTGDISGPYETGDVIVFLIPEDATYNIDIIDQFGCTQGVTIAVTNCSKTSVELVDFYGSVEEIGNQLYWITATEVESKLFRIERSLNGIDFESVGEVEAAYMSNVVNKYELLDRNAPDGLSYYRLIEVDVYGKEFVYNTITLRRNTGNTPITVYPVPAQDILNIQFDLDSEQEVELQLFDISGKLIKSQNIEWIGNYQLDLRTYSAGTYFLTIATKDEIFSTKFAKE